MKFNPKPILEAIKSSMVMPKYESGKEEPRTMPRPPLICGVTLAGVNLDEMNRVVPDDKFYSDELLELAEMYVQTFMIEDSTSPTEYDEDDEPKPTPCQWLRNRMNLSREDAEWLLPMMVKEELSSDVLRHYATMLWWISNAGYPLTFDETHISLTIDGQTIGVGADGKIMSTISGNKGTFSIIPNWKKYLTESAIVHSGKSSHRPWNVAYRATFRMEEGKPIRDAFLILHWRATNKVQLEDSLYEMENRLAPRISRRKILELTTDLEYVDNPYALMKKVLVPTCMTPSNFLQTFGSYNATGERPDIQEISFWRDTILSKYGMRDQVSRVDARNH